MAGRRHGHAGRLARKNLNSVDNTACLFGGRNILPMFCLNDRTREGWAVHVERSYRRPLVAKVGLERGSRSKLLDDTV